MDRSLAGGHSSQACLSRGASASDWQHGPVRAQEVWTTHFYFGEDLTLMLVYGLLPEVAGQRTARTSFVCSAVNSRCQQLRANESAPLGTREEGDGTAATHSTPSGEAGRRVELKQPPLSRRAVQLQKSSTPRLCWRSVEIIRKAYAAPANTHVREIPPRDLGRSLHLLRSSSWPSNR